jgi:hypothetical protein
MREVLSQGWMGREVDKSESEGSMKDQEDGKVGGPKQKISITKIKKDLYEPCVTKLILLVLRIL